jgi:hypothetical protein
MLLPQLSRGTSQVLETAGWYGRQGREPAGIFKAAVAPCQSRRQSDGRAKLGISIGFPRTGLNLSTPRIGPRNHEFYSAVYGILCDAWASRSRMNG